VCAEVEREANFGFEGLLAMRTFKVLVPFLVLSVIQLARGAEQVTDDAVIVEGALSE
jgi:hypothetical protein